MVKACILHKQLTTYPFYVNIRDMIKPALKSIESDTLGIEGLLPSDNPLTPYDVTLIRPHDLYPAQRLFEQRVEEELAQCAPGHPLVILSGEYHPYPEHVMSHITRLAYLLQKQQENPSDPSRQFLFAIEREINRITTWFTDLESDGMVIAEADEENQVALHLDASYNRNSDAPASNRHVSDFIRRNKIETIFNDAARTSNLQNINPIDPLVEQTVEILSKEFPDTSLDNLKHACAENAKGIAIRNVVMVSRALQRAKDTQSKIIFQHCGNAHLFGWIGLNTLMKHSLSWLYREAGARVLPIYNHSVYREWNEFKYFQQEAFPRQALQEFPNTLIFRHMGIKDEYGKDYGRGIQEEQGHLEKLKHIFSGATCPFDFEVNKTLPPTTEDIVERLNANLKKRGHTLWLKTS